MFGNPETTPGGRALKYYASVRIDLRRIGSIKNGDVIVGNRVRAKVVKNKIAPPFRHTEFDILFSEGISAAGDLLDLAVNSGVVSKQGSWFSHGKMRLGQGRERVRDFMIENEDVMKKIESEVKIALGIKDPGLKDSGRGDSSRGDSSLGDSGLGDSGLGDSSLGDSGQVKAPDAKSSNRIEAEAN